jgi:hypothetical protein
MLSYQSALKIPPPEGIAIVDSIDQRDAIIDHLLKRINKKYDDLLQENENLKKSVSYLSSQAAHARVLPHSDAIGAIDPIVASTPTAISDKNCVPKPIERIRRDGSIETVLTESSAKGFEICRPFSNKNYFLSYTRESGKFNEIDHLKLFNDIHDKLSSEYREIEIPGHHVLRSPDEKGVDPSIAVNMDGIDKIWYDYNVFSRKKKFLSSLINICTDYMSESVYVEKMLERLDAIVYNFNIDKQLLDRVFSNIIDEKKERGSIGLIFKGGNVYKLFTYITNSKIDRSVFQNYLADVEQFFKKSDCDFSLVLISTAIDTGDTKFIHLDRTPENENMISTLQYMILNKYRNDFLNEGNSYEYLTLCGKNDRVISAKITRMGEAMNNIIHSGCQEFERAVLKILLETIDFINTDKTVFNSAKLLSPLLSVGSVGSMSRRLLHMIRDDPIYQKCVNDTTKYAFGVKNGKLVDWLGLALAYAVRDSSFYPKDLKFVGIKVPIEFIKKLQNISTDSMEWRDVKTLYNVERVTHMALGDNVYRTLQGKAMTDSEIYDKIISQTIFPDISAKISAQRMNIVGRLHSNRNDFVIKFDKSRPYKHYASGDIIYDTIIRTRTIPYEHDSSGSPQEYITPFYISINKAIEGVVDKFTNIEGVNRFLNNFESISKYGMTGFYNTHDSFKKNAKDLLSVFPRDTTLTHSINFSLARLISSFVIVLQTTDGGYITLPLSAEFIDLSYTYSSDTKVLYEKYENFIPLNGHYSLEKILALNLKYDNLIFQISTDSSLMDVPSQRRKMVSALKTHDYNAISTEKSIMKSLTPLVQEFKQSMGSSIKGSTVVTDPNEDLKLFLRVMKFFTYRRTEGISPLFISYETILFPKLSAYVLDLYFILFVEPSYPWADAKYNKRLQRLLFFLFIDRFRFGKYRTIVDVWDDMGIMVAYSDKDTKQRQWIKKYPYAKNKYNPCLTELYDAINKEKTYVNQYGTARTAQYFNYRENLVYDTPYPQFYDGLLIASCGIDKFMYGFRLLDFFPSYYFPNTSDSADIVRCRYIIRKDIKETATSSSNIAEYVLLTLSSDEVQSIYNEKNNTLAAQPIIEKILTDIPTTVADIGLNNVDVTLPDNSTAKKYIVLSASSTDKFASNLAKYIHSVENIREKLLITIYNFMYESQLKYNSVSHAIEIDPSTILADTYEGDIDKILSVV